jgi:hypothetical protein
MDIKTLAKEPTFRDLLNVLSEMPEEQLDNKVMLYDSFAPVYEGCIPITSIGEISGDKSDKKLEDGTIIFSI